MAETDAPTFSDGRLAACLERPARLRAIDPRLLAPAQRALLATDGTLTTLIEAFAMEPVKVELIGQETLRLTDRQPSLAASKGTQLLARTVLLRGARSGVLHARGAALIVVDRLSPVARQALEADIEGEGLGRIFRSLRLESLREPVWSGLQGPEALPAPYRSAFPAGCLSRCYRIIAGGRPVSLVREDFPLDGGAQTAEGPGTAR